MISIEHRKEIYSMYFIKLHSMRKISKELRISRNAVSKIINEYRLTLEELKLLDKDDLSEYIDLVVKKPTRKKKNCW